MKKIILSLILAAFVFLTTQAQENIAKFYPTGLYLNTGDASVANYMIRFGFERVFTKRLSGQFNIGVGFVKNATVRVVGFSTSRSTSRTAIVTLEPQVHYYLMDDAPKGLYIGGGLAIGVGKGVNGAIIGIAPHVGYQYLLLDNRLAVSAQLGAGVAFYAGSNNTFFGTGFYMPFAVGAGYAF